MQDFKTDIDELLNVLGKGEIIQFQNGTGGWIACDATQTVAVDKFLKITNPQKSHIVEIMIDSTAKINGIVNNAPDIAYDLIELTQKPLTIIFPELKNLASQIIKHEIIAGVNVTDDSFIKMLCMRFRKPILTLPVALKANKSVEVHGLIENVPHYFNEFRKDVLFSEYSDNSSVIQFFKGSVFKIIRE